VDAELIDACNATEVLQMVKHATIDLAFVDMAMPGDSGLTLAAQLRQQQPGIHLIFVTAHAEYALDAYRVAPLDYLLKPVSRDRLLESLSRIPRLQQANEAALVFKQGLTTGRLLLRDVILFQADEKYVRAVTLDGDILLDQSLKQLEHLFAGVLLRIHRNTLVPKARIAHLRQSADGRHQLVLHGSALTPEISRRELVNVRQQLQHLV
jgi:two-component system response regulator AlgR